MYNLILFEDKNIVFYKMTDMSEMLSKNLSNLYISGDNLINTSSKCEKKLIESIDELIDSIEKKYNVKIIKKIKMDNTEIKRYLPKEYYSDEKIPIKGYIKPDGGILLVKIIDTGEIIPLLVSEHKSQGTNDKRNKEGLKKQSCGNAIERSIKNINTCFSLFSKYEFFPYVIFGEGCDLHHTGTISTRLESANMYKKPFYIPIGKDTTQEQVNEKISEICNKINVFEKIAHIPISTICLKAHKWDEMEHGSSTWNKCEIIMILKEITRQVLNYIDENIHKIKKNKYKIKIKN